MVLAARSRTADAFRPGAHFRDGRLLAFSAFGVTAADPWPALAAYRKTGETPFWRACRPKFDIRTGRVWGPGPRGHETYALTRRPAGLPDSSAAAFQAFLQHVPKDVARLIRDFPGRHWHLLQLACRCDGAADLLASNPALAFAVASNWVFRPISQPMRAARSLLRLRQRDVAGRLGFPATRSAARILARIPPPAVTVERLLYLREALREPSAHKLLRHCPRLNAGALRLATDPALRPHVEPTLLEEVGADREEDRSPSAAYDLRDVLLGHPRGDRLVFQRQHEVACAHDDLIEAVRRFVDGPYQPPVRLPAPPLPATPLIVPLTSAADLLEEGRRQHNCVGSYARRVAEGECYIYRSQAAEPATVEVRRHGARWVLGQVRAACNRRASAATMRAVRAWVAGQ